MGLERAMEFIEEKHKGQTRKCGEAYVTHPIAVSEIIRDRGLSEDAILTALFHDLLEDTDATEVEIRDLSNQRVLDAVKLLTKYKGYNMEVYISGIQQNPIALCVKLADRIHNVISTLVCEEAFQKKYLDETEKYYLTLARGTIFEEEMNKVYEDLKMSYQEKLEAR